MFLMERLIGVSIYSYILIMMCVLIAFSTLRCKNVLRLYLALLAGMAYCYKPYITADLYRIFQAMEWYATMEFPGFFKNLVLPSSVPASRILFWLVGKTGLPHLLPLISTLLCYGCLFYIIENTRVRFRISRANVAITLFFLMTTSIYISVIGGIRMMLALSIIALCFYRESVEKKHNILHILLGLVALFLHDMALVMLGVVLLAILFDRRKSSSSKLLWGLLIGVLAIGIAVYFNTKIISVTEKSLEYLSDETYYDIWEYLMGGILFCLFGFLFFKAKPYHENYLEINCLNTATAVSGVIALLFCHVFSIFYRFIGHMVPILGIPFLMISLQEIKDTAPHRFKIISLQSLVMLVSIVLLMISATRGSLSALKFFVID